MVLLFLQLKYIAFEIEAFNVKINWWRCIYIRVSLDIHLILFHPSVHVSVAINNTIYIYILFFVVGNCYKYLKSLSLFVKVVFVVRHNN